MEPNDEIFKLQLITLFDSLSFGLIYAFLSPYMFVLGGDNITIGLLTVTTLIAQLLSADIVRDLIQFQGRRAALYTIFNVAAVCHALLFLTSSCWFTILARCIFASTNQSSSIVKKMILNKTPSEDVEFQLMIFNILSSSGYLIGPIIAGCLFDVSFTICCFLASCLTMGNICLLTLVEDSAEDTPTEGSDVAMLQRTAQTLKDAAIHFRGSDYRTNWDVISLKYLFTGSLTIFFSKFTQILKHNFNSDSVAIGYTTSYMNALMFIGIYLSQKLRKNVENIPRTLLLNYAFAVLFTSTFVACYSPLYIFYAFMCIPIVLARTLILDLWEDFVSDRKNDDLKKVSDAVSVGAGVTVPILFGIVCNQIGHHAVVIFSVLPLLGSLIIVYRVTSSHSIKHD